MLKQSGSKTIGSLYVRVFPGSKPIVVKDEAVRIGIDAPDAAYIAASERQTTVRVDGLSVDQARSMSDALGESVIANPDAKRGPVTVIINGRRRQFERDRLVSALGHDLVEVAELIACKVDNAYAPPKLPAPSSLCLPGLRRLYDSLMKRTAIMGVLNVTPDSFSDGGQFKRPDDAVQAGIRMAAEGADIIDVGGESTRPGALPVSESEELERVLPVIYGLAAAVEVPVSIDTTKAEVAKYALMAGASIVNDVSGGKREPEILSHAAHHRAALVLMHSKGDPRTMQDNPVYDDLMGEIYCALECQISAAVDEGVSEEMIIVDPGFGFGKTVKHNLTLLRRLSELKSLGRPILVGTSRKSTLGAVAGNLPVSERLEATAASVAIAIANGASIVRVHDVKEIGRAVRTADAIVRVF